MFSSLYTISHSLSHSNMLKELQNILIFLIQEYFYNICILSLYKYIHIHTYVLNFLYSVFLWYQTITDLPISRQYTAFHDSQNA